MEALRDASRDYAASGFTGGIGLLNTAIITAR